MGTKANSAANGSNTRTVDVQHIQGNTQELNDWVKQRTKT